MARRWQAQLQLLVEITVVEPALPVHTQQAAAHHAGEILLAVVEA
jgi:hypothetical protein